ncbi:hypothetical protein [Pseudarthrobacter sp. Y6]|uniref:hypothetical protein n=1 Tax=Pseudarthrobacter sp. Y6 TaxID=3418422 RepID=UPI003CE99A7A
MTRPIQTPPPGRKARVAGIVAAALVISWGGPAASAYWQTLSSNDGAAKADSIVALAAPVASGSGGAASVSWAQGTTAAGRLVSSYTVARYSSATGGTKVAAGGGCLGTITARTCSEAALPSGTWYYTVTPVVGSWAGVESSRSSGVVGDSTPPAIPTVTAPAVVNISNVATVPVSVTAETGSSVKVTVTDTPPPGTPQQTLTQNLTANGSVQTMNFDLSTFSQGTITYTAIATDAAGNVSNPGAATSTKDTVAPTAKVTLFSPSKNTAGVAETGDTVRIKYSADINSKTICSSWTNGVQPPDIAGNNVVTVTISSANILTVTTAGAACTPNIGPVTLGANYVSSGSLTFTGTGNGGGASKVAWDNASQTLTITLGTRSGTANTGVGTSSPTVAPPAGVTDTSGNQAVGVAPDAASRF